MVSDLCVPLISSNYQQSLPLLSATKQWKGIVSRSRSFVNLNTSVITPCRQNTAKCLRQMLQYSAALTVSWLGSLPLQDCSGPRLGLCSWSETGRDAPPGSSGRWHSLWSRCWQPGLTVCLWASCNALRHTERPRFGPVWRSPDNRASPDSSCTAQNTPQSWCCSFATGLPWVRQCCAVWGRCHSHTVASQSSSRLCARCKNNSHYAT